MSDEQQLEKLVEPLNVYRSEEQEPDESKREELPSTASDEISGEKIRLSAWMYLRTIFLMAWGAFRHPFRTTYIDMTNGEVVHIRPGEEMWE